MFGRGFSPYSAYGLGAAPKTGINWSSLLSNTQKTLGIINQAIPAFYQIKPIFGNMKTMFKVVNEINKDDTKKTNNNIDTSQNYNNTYNYSEQNINTTKQNNSGSNSYQSSDEGPSFFI